MVSAQQDGIGSPLQFSANDVTRALCSSALLIPSWAAVAFDHLCRPRIRTLAPCPGVDLVALARHAASALRRRFLRALVLAASYVVLVIAGFGVLVGLPPGRSSWFLVLLIVLAVSKAFVVGHDLSTLRTAIAVYDGGRVDLVRGHPVRPDQEARLAATNETDLAIYSPGLDQDPFPGVGQQVKVDVIPPVDLSKPHDRDQPVRSFTPLALMQHLAEALPRHVTVTDVNDALRSRLVLHVRGAGLRPGADLVPGDGPPVPHAPPSLLAQVADHPTADSRTYVQAQIVGHGGHVVTTLDFTATRSPLGLGPVIVLHVLRPLHDVYYAAAHLPRQRHRLVWRVAVQGGIWPGYRASFRQAIRTGSQLLAAQRPARMGWSEKRASGVRDFYGAGLGLREMTSFETTFRFNEQNDAEAQFLNLVDALLRELDRFFEAHNIDTEAFKKQKARFVQNVYNSYKNTMNQTYNQATISAGGSISVGGDFNTNVQNLPNVGGTSGPSA